MNFKILQVNGQDLSGASQEDATAAFTRAEEPITVVVRRATSTNCQQQEQSWTNQARPVQQTGVCASTQTSEKKAACDVQPNKLCLCQHLMQLCAANPTSVFSTIILNELIRLRNESMSLPQPEAVTKPNLVTTTTTTATTQRHMENTSTDHMEVVLNRTSQRQKLGIVLRDHKNRADGTIYVYISDIVKGSIADKCERLQPGDRVLSINGQNVGSMSQAASVLQQQSSIIVLVISRKNPALDKHPATTTTTKTQSCAEHAASKSPLIPTQKVNTASNNQCLPASCAQPQVGPATGKNQEPPKIATSPCSDTKGSCCKAAAAAAAEESKSPSTGDLRCSYDEDTAINGSDPPHSLAHEFTFVEPKDYDRPIKPVRFIGGGVAPPSPPPPAHAASSEIGGGGSPGKMPTSGEVNTAAAAHQHHHHVDATDYRQLSELEKLVTAIEHLEMEQLDDEAYEDDEDDEGEEGLDLVDSPFVVSPWVKIARQDYEDVMRAEQNRSHVCRRVVSENKTNRYHHHHHHHHHAITGNGQAGEPGKRTSSVGTDSTSSAYSTGESMRSSSTAGGSTSQSSAADGRSCKSSSHVTAASSSPNCVTINYSDENDGCYMTHDEHYNSEDDVRATAKEARAAKEGEALDCKRAAAATSPVSTPGLPPPPPPPTAGVGQHHNELYKSSSVSVSAESVALPTAAPAMEDQQHHQHGRQQQQQQPGSGEDKGHKSEWKVKIRRDGTRYITKRPTATRRERQSTTSERDLVVATDDEAVEVEGQCSARAGRQQQQQQQSGRNSRERKRRRKQRGRLESLQENAPGSAPSSSSSSKDKIAEMSRHKVARRKRMLLGSFATVQEILAHGRANPSELAEVNPLLSVTYI